MAAFVPCAADDLSGYAEFLYATADREFDAAGLSQDTASHGFVQSYNLFFDKSFWPNVRLWGAGQFRRADQTSDVDGVETDLTVETQRPNLGLRVGTPFHVAELTYSRNEQDSETTGAPDLTLIRDQYKATFGLFPEGLPSAQLQLFRTEDRDGNRAFRDVTRDLVQFISDYRPVEEVLLQYRGSRTNTQDDIARTEVEDLASNARVTYSDLLADGRLSLYTDYNYNYRRTTITASGTGEVDLPLFPFAGLSAIDDTPEDGALPANPALIDDDLSASAGIDIGLEPPGGDDRPRNMGLDFGSVMEVNTLSVWVDQDLPPQIAASFLWSIYTSSDNQTWFLRATVPALPIEPFVPRFEIRFANVSDRYVKAVVAPLGPTVPDASSFPDILVTELQASIRVAAADAEREQSGNNNLFDLNLRARLTESPLLYYELSSFGNGPDLVPDNYTIINGISLAHPFSDVYSVSARVAREDIQRINLETLAWVYTTSLSVTPVPTLRYNVAFSGRTEDTAGFTTDRNSVFLYAIADLYRGVGLNVGVGKTYTTRDPGTDSETTLINATTTLVPNDQLAFNVIYRDSSTVNTGVVPQTPETNNRATEANFTYTPVQTLFLFGSYRVESAPDADHRTIDNYAVSWSPFPDGTLHFTISYNETLRSELDQTDESFVSRMRWDISRLSFLDVTYQRIRTDSDTQAQRDDIVSANLRIGF
jgi:hypothetical protein